MARIGYFNIEDGTGSSFQVDEIENAGHEAVRITALTTEALAGIDVLYALNPSNSAWGATFAGALPILTEAVENGLHLVVADRRVTGADLVLPGAADVEFVRRTGLQNVVLDEAAPELYLSGAAGQITEDTFDNGSSSGHGYAVRASLPVDAVPLMTWNDDSDHILTFAYGLRAGAVFYSAIPLDYYSERTHAGITPEDVTLFLGNAVDFLRAGRIVTAVDRLGGAGADTLLGDQGADLLQGEGGDDSLVGYAGADTLDGGSGRDTMNGGAGSDLYLVDNPDDVLVELADSGRDHVRAASDYTLLDHFEFLTLTGSANLRGTGNDQSNVITGNEGDNLLQGMGGDDWLDASDAGHDTLEGGDGRDTVSLARAGVGGQLDLTNGSGVREGMALVLTEIENLTGTSFDDYLRGDAQDNRIRGLAGQDWILGEGGDDTLDGGAGLDMVSYVGASRKIRADLESGTVRVGGETDQLISIEGITGSRFADHITAGGSNAYLRGMAGRDWFVGGTGFDRFDGGAHVDTVAYTETFGGVTASLLFGVGTRGAASGDRYIGIENLTGSGWADNLSGDSGANVLRGLGGSDLLTGHGGADRIMGGSGNDMIDGGTGWDRAMYRHDRDDYTVQTRDGVTTVRYDAGGGEGTDTLVNIEALMFADGLLYL